MSKELKGLCARWWADRLEIVEKRDDFKQALLPKIRADDMTLSVDYDPDDVLLEALHSVQIKCSGAFFSARGILPLKTSMNIRDGVVKVKEGYGGGYVQIMLPESSKKI